MLSTLDLSLIVGYIVVALIIGYVSSRRQSGNDFMIANRNLGTFSFVSSSVASLIGGTMLVVYTAYVFEFGAGALLGFAGLFLGFLFFIGSAMKLRRTAHKERFHTLADFFNHYFGNKVGMLVAIIILVWVILGVLKQFIAGTQILSAISGFDYGYALLISAAVILVYLVLGGFKSVVKTDVFQYLMMVFLLFVIGFAMTNSAQLPLEEISNDSTPIILIIFFFIYGALVPWTSPDIWQRIYAAKNDMVVKKGLIISGIFLVIVGIGIALIGLSARFAFPDIDASQSLVYGLTNLLDPGVLGLGIVLVFAAIMSSADTLIFILASNISKDFISKIKKRTLSDTELRKYTRINLILIIFVATFLAYFFRNLIDLAIVNAGLILSIAPAIIARFKWKTVKRGAVKASLISGVLYIVVLSIFGVFDPQFMFASVIVAAFVLLIFQKICKR